MLPNGNHIFIRHALFSRSFGRNLLNFKYKRINQYHIATITKGNKELLCIISNVGSQKITRENFSSYSSCLYFTNILNIESYSIIGQKLKENLKISDHMILTLQCNRLGHPSSTIFRKITVNSYGHPLINYKLSIPNDHLCIPRSQERLISAPCYLMIAIESPKFQEKLNSYIYGPTHSPSYPFRHFMVIIGASTQW